MTHMTEGPCVACLIKAVEHVGKSASLAGAPPAAIPFMARLMRRLHSSATWN